MRPRTLFSGFGWVGVPEKRAWERLMVEKDPFLGDLGRIFQRRPSELLKPEVNGDFSPFFSGSENSHTSWQTGWFLVFWDFLNISRLFWEILRENPLIPAQVFRDLGQKPSKMGVFGRKYEFLRSFFQGPGIFLVPA